MPFPEIDVCVFCGVRGVDTPEGELTKEHAFPNWVVEELKPVIGDREVYLAGHLLSQYPGLDVEIQAVCRTCNSEWLSKTFEWKVSKWLRPSLLHLEPRVTFGHHQRGLVAAWAVKTALMVELALAELRRPAFTPKRHFDWLYEHRVPPRNCKPPPGVTVWVFGVNIASGVGIVKALMGWSAASSVFVPEMGEGPKGYFATFTVGYLGFQVHGWDLGEAELSDMKRPVRPPMPLQMREAVQQLWPARPKPPYRWPYISDTGGVLLATRDQASMSLMAEWPWRSNLQVSHRDIPAQAVWIPPESGSPG